MVNVIGTVGSVAQRSRAIADGWIAGVDDVDVEGITIDWFAQNDQRLTSDASVKSDPEIAQAVRDAFRFDAQLNNSPPQVAVRDGEVVLSGTVDGPRERDGRQRATRKNTLGVWRIPDKIWRRRSRKPDRRRPRSRHEAHYRRSAPLARGKINPDVEREWASHTEGSDPDGPRASRRG